jgi:excisionase family DNA binding protein
MASREITVPELAKRLGCSIPLAQALIRKGKIRGRKAARGWVTTTAAVEAYLAKRAAQGSGKKK